jgi:glycosyltransferase involved in cell wall biosynthesis
MPRVTVILPAYNSRRFLAPAIDSILNQTFRDFEFLIHDDGSKDDTFAMIQSYAAKDPRIKATTSANQGVSATRNGMIAAAKGDFIAIMDHDDIATPQRLALQVAFLDANPNHAMVGGQVEWMDEEGLTIAPLSLPQDSDEIERNLLEGHCRIAHAAVMVRASVLRQVGGYDSSFPVADDYELWLRVSEVGKIANLPQLLLRYRIVANGLSGSRYLEQHQDTRRACLAARRRRGLPPESDPIEQPPVSETYQNWTQLGWVAWKAGNRPGWQRYALRAIKEQPLSKDAWKLLVFGALRRP